MNNQEMADAVARMGAVERADYAARAAALGEAHRRQLDVLATGHVERLSVLAAAKWEAERGALPEVLRQFWPDRATDEPIGWVRLYDGDVAGQFEQATPERVAHGHFASEDGWEPVYAKRVRP